MPPSTTNSANGKRFELPQLTPVNYSLTDGTNIPPPPDSPVEEVPPPIAPKPQVADPVSTSTTVVGSTTTSNEDSLASPTHNEPRGRTPSTYTEHSQAPLSPASINRPGSIRRFLSRRSLNSTYTNGAANGNKSVDDLSQYNNSATAGSGGHRPGSSLEQGPRPKRSTSWFRRFGSSSSGNVGGPGNRTSVVYEEKEKIVEKKGPPPPKLPELKLGGEKGKKEDDGGLGGEDMFRNIK